GDACTALLKQDAQGQRLANCRAELGLDRPAHQRYLQWASGAVRGDFGVSAHSSKRISTLVADRVRNSLLLGATALAAGLPLAFAAGVLAALRRDRALDLTLSALAIAAMTIPEFVSATILILVFSGWLGWLPGIVLTPPDAPLSRFFPEIILPVAALSMVMTAHILRTVRSSMIEVLDSEYVRMATLKGVPYRTMVLRHVLPNALLPAIHVVALTVAWLLGGVVVIEMVFNYPGLGRLMIGAISDRDLALVQAIALIVATVYVVVNLTADLLTLLANPRLRTAHSRRS
ncbi:MAG: ABC transporter permease, partial [Rhodoferax sp.]|nr:ABC transporter permease [Rhodoferax sp.]